MNDVQPDKKPKQTRHSHGFTRLLQTRHQADLSKVDGRTVLARTIQEWRAELVAALGGSEVLSAQQAMMVDMIIRDRLAIESIENWLATQPSLVNKRKRSLYPIVQQLSTLKDGLTRRLLALGLERKAKPTKTLQDLLSGPKASDQATA